jgi:hypothetical protein
MVWRKAWYDTRWRFAILLAVLAAIACFNVFEWLAVQTIVPKLDASGAGPGGRVASALAEALAAEQTFRGYIWYEWFSQNFRTCIVLFAALLGSGSALSTSGRGLLFSLTLPVSRGRWLAARAAIGIAEVLALAVVPSLEIALIFVLGGVFFALAMLVSSFVDDFGRAIVLTAVAAIVLAFAEAALPAGHGLFAGLSGGAYFRNGTLPWLELLGGAVLTLALFYAAAAWLARRDF